MIFLSDDYVNKYQDVLGYIISRAINEKYATPFIERTIAYSLPFIEFEKSNITRIAFSSMESIYQELFPKKENMQFVYNPYDEFGWVGYTYIRLFFDLRVTFELLFIIIPIDELLSMYHLYHEMDYTQTLMFVKSKIKHSYLDNVMINRQLSSKDVSSMTNISYSTIKSLRYGIRDINKYEAYSLLKIAIALNVRVETLLTDIYLLLK